MVRRVARALGLTAALAVAFLWAFLTWRGLTLECPEWDEEGASQMLPLALPRV